MAFALIPRVSPLSKTLAVLTGNTIKCVWRSYGEPATAKEAVKGLMQRLEDGECVLCAEGYLLALARMGYIAHGVWVPDFILDQPEVLRNVHYEFIHSGTDVTEAFQYYTHCEKTKQIGREGDLESINRIALGRLLVTQEH